MPGVQKPHCRPCISRKPSCNACKVPSALAMPSMVRISVPFAWMANTVHDFTDLPSRSTVQAPQWLGSQPICGPVRVICSRKKWLRGGRVVGGGRRDRLGVGYGFLHGRCMEPGADKDFRGFFGPERRLGHIG